MKTKKEIDYKKPIYINSFNADEIIFNKLRGTHVKACKAMYVLSSRVRMVEGGQTVVKEMTTYHPTKKLAVSKMEEEYREVTGGDPEGRGDWVHYESTDGSVVATFEIYKPVVG